MLLARSKTQLLLPILITLSKLLNSNYLFFLAFTCRSIVGLRSKIVFIFTATKRLYSLL